MGGVILPSPNPIIGQFEKENGIPKGTGKYIKWWLFDLKWPQVTFGDFGWPLMTSDDPGWPWKNDH